MDMGFDRQMEEFMIDCHSRQLRPKTMNSYEQTLRLFERWCKEEMHITDVDKVSENIVRRYILQLQERGKYSFYANDAGKGKNCPERRRDYCKPVSITTVNNYLRNLKVFFRWLTNERIIDRNPMQRIKELKYERRAKEYMEDAEFKKLIGLLDKSYYSEHRDYMMILLMMDTGMRLGECSCLMVDDIDMKKRSIFLRAEITKGRKDRMVFFSDRTETALRRWMSFKERHAESVFLFPMKATGEHVTVSAFERNFRLYLKRASIKTQYTPHCLRNNFAKRCLMRGMDIYTLSKILGHSSVTVTEQAYLDLTEEDLGKRYQYFSPVASML